MELAILENGQYDEAWRYIHMMPRYLLRAARELGAERVLTVHHSKYALASHPWDEPRENARRAAQSGVAEVSVPAIGDLVPLRDSALRP